MISGAGSYFVPNPTRPKSLHPFFIFYFFRTWASVFFRTVASTSRPFFPESAYMLCKPKNSPISSLSLRVRDESSKLKSRFEIKHALARRIKTIFFAFKVNVLLHLRLFAQPFTRIGLFECFGQGSLPLRSCAARRTAERCLKDAAPLLAWRKSEPGRGFSAP